MVAQPDIDDGSTGEQTAGDALVGDWLVVPGPLDQHGWRWGRIVAVLRRHGACYYQVRWYGDDRDSVVLAPADARIEPASAWPHPGGDAFGAWPE